MKFFSLRHLLEFWDGWAGWMDTTEAAAAKKQEGDIYFILFAFSPPWLNGDRRRNEINFVPRKRGKKDMICLLSGWIWG